MQLEFNKHRSELKHLDQSVNEIVANATEAFEQQKVDLIPSHQTNTDADRLMPDQLIVKFDDLKKEDGGLRDSDDHVWA